jgi:hypothetical protein
MAPDKGTQSKLQQALINCSGEVYLDKLSSNNKVCLNVLILCQGPVYWLNLNFDYGLILTTGLGTEVHSRRVGLPGSKRPMLKISMQSF